MNPTNPKRCQVCQRTIIPKSARRKICKACYNRAYYANVYKLAGVTPRRPPPAGLAASSQKT